MPVYPRHGQHGPKVIVKADAVVLATGASARTLPCLAGLSNVFTLRTMADAQSLAPELVPGSRLTVLGAGFIGAEVASAAASRGMEVTMIDAKPVPFAAHFGNEMGAVVAGLHRANGVELISAAVEDFFTSEGNVSGLRLADGRCIGTDVVVVGIGSEPNTAWLQGSGVRIADGVVCDGMGRTNMPGIVAVGDCAAWFDESSGSHRRVGHWTAALERPALAVAALLDETAPQQPLKPGYFWSDQHGVKLQFAGDGGDHDRVAIESGDPLDHSFLAVYYRYNREDVPRGGPRAEPKGQIRAFYNICRHRGVKLCMEEQGEAARSFQCPYHAWTYDFEGKIIAAPNLTKMPDIDRDEYGLVKVHIHEYLGYVWVCLADDEPPSFEEDIMGAIEEHLGDVHAIDGYDVANLSLGRRIRYDVKANWKLIIENFMECYHCATIHPELTEVLPEFADGLAAQYFVGHGAEFGEDVKGFTVDGSEGLDLIPGVSEDQDRRYYAITIKPTVFVNLVPDHVIIHRMFPMAADHTIVECDWLYLPAWWRAARMSLPPWSSSTA